MSSLRALRTCMQVLVILDLVFVWITEAAGLHWLLPLFTLALLAPLLERYREKLAYRALWNGGVVCFLGVLVNHAMQANLAYVLEDGLVMAVLCQVHLLNNLRSEQRPDLLFFNAFLIAIITGFMTRGIAFPVAFLAFVPVYVVGLQLLSATRDGHAPASSATRRLVLDAVRRGGAVLVASLFVFLFWPRDFERKAFFHGKFDFPERSGELRVGYNEEVILALREHVGAANRRALRVTLLEGDASSISPLWRGATSSVTDGQRWRPLAPSTAAARAPVDELWRGGGGRLFRIEPEAGPVARVEVVRFEQKTERLFAPLGAFELVLEPEYGTSRVRARHDGTIDVTDRDDVRYELRIGAGDVSLGGRTPDPLPQELAPFVELPDAPGLVRARELAETFAARLPQDAEQHELVALMRESLERSYAYLPPGAKGAAGSLDEFLRGKPAHCEFFASALAVMLRSRGVPCRVVTGFRGDDWTGRVLAIGTRDAHAWVEVHDPEGGWYAVDPSPALAADGGTSFWDRAQARAQAFWAMVTGFDAERRAALFAWMGRRLVMPLAVLLLSVLLVVVLVRRRRARVDPAVEAYLDVLHRLKLSLESGETPRELLARARTMDLDAEQVDALTRATRAHEATRYAGLHSG